MAITVTGLNNPIGAAIWYDTSLNATAQTDIRAGSTTVYVMQLDNTANSAATYVCLYDNGAPTVGTTAPDFVFKVPANTLVDWTCLSGMTFTNLSLCAKTTAGTAGTTNPVSAFAIRIQLT